MARGQRVRIARVGIQIGRAAFVGIILSGCVSEQVTAPREDISSIDGAPLNTVVMRQMREAQGCSFSVPEGIEAVRRLTLKEKALPYDLPKITRSTAGRGNGRRIRVSFNTPSVLTTISADCWVRASMGVTDVAGFIAAFVASDRFYQRIRANGTRIEKAALVKTMSRESRQLVYELIDPKLKPMTMTTAAGASASRDVVCYIYATSPPPASRSAAGRSDPSSCQCDGWSNSYSCVAVINGMHFDFSVYDESWTGIVTDADICGGDCGGGGEEEEGGGDEVVPCPPEDLACLQPLTPADTMLIHQALDSALLRTTYSADSIRVMCTTLFNAVKSRWVTNKSTFYRGNVGIPDGTVGHDAYTFSGMIHVDGDWLSGGHPAGHTLALLMHEIAHEFGDHAGDDYDYSHGLFNQSVGYRNWPFNLTSSSSSDSCVPGSW